MKFLILYISLILIAINSFAQVEPANNDQQLKDSAMKQPGESSTTLVIPRNANTILIYGITFRSVKDTLLNHNYFFEKIDTSEQLITTQPKTIKAYTYIFNLRIKDSLLYISGRGTTNLPFYGNQSVYGEIKNCGMSGSPAKIAFNQLITFAKLFSDKLDFKVQ